MKPRMVCLWVLPLIVLIVAGRHPRVGSAHESSIAPVPLPVWVSEVAVPGAVGEPHALALDAADNPYLLYYQPAAEALRWAARNGDTWTTSLVAEHLRGLKMEVRTGVAVEQRNPATRVPC